MTRSIEALPPSRTPLNRARMVLGLVLAAGLALGPAACDRKTPSEKAISGASRQLGAVSEASSSAGTAAAYLEPRLSAVRRDVKELGSEPPAMDTASASLISARAAGGLAGLKATQAAQFEDQARQLGLLVYATLDAYGAQASFAAGLEQFDPAPESKRLTDEVAAKEQEISKAAGAKRQLQDEAAKLEADTQAALGAAQGERTTEAQIRRQAQDVSGQAKTDLITKANEHRRVADGHDKRASDLRSQSAVLAPRIEQAQAQLDHLTGQRKLLQDAIAEIQGIAQSSKQRATEARASVAKSAEDIAANLTKLEAARKEVETPAKAAIDGYKSAAADAGKASQGASPQGKGGAKIAQGNYLASAGGIAADRADGFRAYAALLESLAAAKPALPNADKYTAAAAEARKSEEESRKEAAELLGHAKDAIGGGGGDDAKALSERIGAASEALSTNSVKPAKSLALGGEVAKGGGGGAGGGGPDQQILDRLRSVEGMLKEGRLDSLLDMVILPPGPISDFGPVLLDLDAAMKEKFNEGLLTMLVRLGRERKGEFGPIGALDTTGFNEQLKDVEIKVTGDTAVLGSKKDPSEKVPMKKVDGKWKVDIVAIPEAAGMMMMAGPMIAKLTPDIKAITAEVREGKYANTDEFIKGIGPRMQKAMGGMGGFGGGG